jgi:hypothetical protein
MPKRKIPDVFRLCIYNMQADFVEEEGSPEFSDC